MFQIYTLNIRMQLPVIGCCCLWVMHCQDNVCLSLFLEITIGSIQWHTEGGWFGGSNPPPKYHIISVSRTHE
jgi:hypothetical protein